MGCTGCSVAIENGTPQGCGSKGNCGTGGCNRMNTHDWLAEMNITDVDGFNIIEVSFKNGARKAFFRAERPLQVLNGDWVVVEAKGGYDIGAVSLSGELVRLQMKKRKVKEDNVLENVIRIANERDMERLQEARSREKGVLVHARTIARTLALDMKMGDIEFRGDNRKATFYYTANGRVDFRELIRHYAKEFKVKIEMRQIGARQESARIGGLGACGRELCCSTWLTDFKSVSTAAARYQNLAINQSKLSGQCGRLKCCLNYELDTYMEAVQAFPKKADKILTRGGKAALVKTDIFKQLMYYSYMEGRSRGKLFALSIEQVEEIIDQNKRGEATEELSLLATVVGAEAEDEHDYEDVTGVIDLPIEKRRKKRKKRNTKRNKPTSGGGAEGKKQPQATAGSGDKTDKPKEGEEKRKSSNSRRRNNRRRSRTRNKNQNNENNQKKD